LNNSIPISSTEITIFFKYLLLGFSYSKLYYHNIFFSSK